MDYIDAPKPVIPYTSTPPNPTWAELRTLSSMEHAGRGLCIALAIVAGFSAVGANVVAGRDSLGAMYVVAAGVFALVAAVIRTRGTIRARGGR